MSVIYNEPNALMNEDQTDYDAFRFGGDDAELKARQADDMAKQRSRGDSAKVAGSGLVDPLQFIKSGKKTERFVEDAKNMQRVMEKQKEERTKVQHDVEDWQTDLSSWKSKMRRKSSTAFERAQAAEEQLKEEEDLSSKKKIKSFKAMQENRNRGRMNFYPLGEEEEDEGGSISSDPPEDAPIKPVAVDVSKEEPEPLERWGSKGKVVAANRNKWTPAQSNRDATAASKPDVLKDTPTNEVIKAHTKARDVAAFKDDSRTSDVTNGSEFRKSNLTPSFTSNAGSSNGFRKATDTAISYNNDKSAPRNWDKSTSAPRVRPVRAFLEKYKEDTNIADAPAATTQHEQHPIEDRSAKFGAVKSAFERPEPQRQEPPVELARSEFKPNGVQKNQLMMSNATGSEEELEEDQELTQNDLVDDLEERVIKIRLGARSARGFGFSLKGGKDTRQPVTVERVTLGSAADVNELQAGDQIVKIDGASVASHYLSSVQGCVNKAATTGNIELVIRRPRHASSATDDDLTPLRERSSFDLSPPSAFDNTAEPTSPEYGKPPLSSLLSPEADRHTNALYNGETSTPFSGSPSAPPPLPSSAPPPPNWSSFPSAPPDPVDQSLLEDLLPDDSAIVGNRPPQNETKERKLSASSLKTELIRKKSAFLGISAETSEELKSVEKEKEARKKEEDEWKKLEESKLAELSLEDAEKKIIQQLEEDEAKREKERFEKEQDAVKPAQSMKAWHSMDHMSLRSMLSEPVENRDAAANSVSFGAQTSDQGRRFSLNQEEERKRMRAWQEKQNVLMQADIASMNGSVQAPESATNSERKYQDEQDALRRQYAEEQKRSEQLETERRRKEKEMLDRDLARQKEASEAASKQGALVDARRREAEQRLEEERKQRESAYKREQEMLHKYSSSYEAPLNPYPWKADAKPARSILKTEIRLEPEASKPDALSREESKALQEKERQLKEREEKVRREQEAVRAEREALLREKDEQLRLRSEREQQVPLSRSRDHESTNQHAPSRSYEASNTTESRHKSPSKPPPAIQKKPLQLKKELGPPKPARLQSARSSEDVRVAMSSKGGPLWRDPEQSFAADAWITPRETAMRRNAPKRSALLHQASQGDVSTHWVVQEAERRRMRESNERSRLQKLHARSEATASEQLYAGGATVAGGPGYPSSAHTQPANEPIRAAQQLQSHKRPDLLPSSPRSPNRSSEDARAAHPPPARYSDAYSNNYAPSSDYYNPTQYSAAEKQRYGGGDVDTSSKWAPPLPPKTQNAVSPVSPYAPPPTQFDDHPQAEVVSVVDNQRCAHCDAELGQGAAMTIDSLGLYYHMDCFRCCVCCASLVDAQGSGAADVRVRGQKLHCHDCYSNDEEGLKYSRV